MNDSRVVFTRKNGFTLVEILVALAIIAIALAALIKASSSHTYSASYLKEKTLAHYVAMNELALLQITRTWPEENKVNESTEMAGHEWYWTRETETIVDFITGKPSTQFIKVNFTVYSDEDRTQNAARVSGYVALLPDIGSTQAATGDGDANN
jgi:type II secretion system protein I